MMKREDGARGDIYGREYTDSVTEVTLPASVLEGKVGALGCALLATTEVSTSTEVATTAEVAAAGVVAEVTEAGGGLGVVGKATGPAAGVDGGRGGLCFVAVAAAHLVVEVSAGHATEQSAKDAASEATAAGLGISGPARAAAVVGVHG